MIEGPFPTKGLAALEALADAYCNGCNTCEVLCDTRSQVVFGSGHYAAKIMVVSDAPGEVEDREGIPFVGDAGRLLMDLFAHAWPRDAELERIKSIGDADEYFEELRIFLDTYIFWTNIVMCWPGEGNRDPSTAEKKACRDRLYRTIYAVDPAIIIGVGKPAASTLLGASVPIVAKHGTIFDVRIPSPATGESVRYPMMAMLPPSFLLKKGDQDLIKKKKGYSYKALQDLAWLVDLLQEHHSRVHDSVFPMEPDDV